MNYPKYILRDGYIGTFQRVDPVDIPIYRFPGGDSMADIREIEHGSDDRSVLEAKLKEREEVKELLKKPVDEMTLEEKMKVIKAAGTYEDFNVVEEQMQAILENEEVKCYDMMEDLMNAYNEASDDSFRRGMDKACIILTWHSVAGIAQKILQEVGE